MPNGVRKSGKTQHANNQRAKMEQKYLEKMETLKEDFQQAITTKDGEMATLREQVKTITDALNKAEGKDLGEVASLKKKLSSARIQLEEQTKTIARTRVKIANLEEKLYNPVRDDELSKMIREMWDTEDLCGLCKGVELKHPHKHNAQPITSGFCCSKCNDEKVVPLRMAMVGALNGTGW